MSMEIVYLQQDMYSDTFSRFFMVVRADAFQWF